MTRVRDDAVRQIVLADNALRTSLSAHSASEALRSAAQTTFDAALAAYRGGVGSITDVTMAETQLLQARNATTDAYSYRAVRGRDARARDRGSGPGANMTVA